jgi:uncharacterized phage-associated protein
MPISETGPFDPRAICNLILDEADRDGISVTNLALQKLLYFLHGIFLSETKGCPLVSGYFEAWTYGPVHPVAYQAFKSADSNPITFRASVRDPLTLQPRELVRCEDDRARALVRRVVATHARMSVGRLVEISHAKGGPWAHIVDEARTSVVLGHRIPNDVILSRFRHHKVSVGAEPANGEPNEDFPLGRI